MGMNQTPASERVHISFFGKRNAGKSSVINAVTGQDLAIVSSVMGTTTDPSTRPWNCFHLARSWSLILPVLMMKVN